ncbi:hypothetical protein [Azorhizophilus paspali]|uniref:Uncharacterized protein n=1 Tax=Azorhizophilus paspali TaxID=69963 RepID=A0ABV6SHH0_AZOPA
MKTTTDSLNLALLPPEMREQIEAHKAECLELYRAALDLASRIYLQRRDKGKRWRMWAERELAAHPELEKEARAKLNRLMKGAGSDHGHSD